MLESKSVVRAKKKKDKFVRLNAFEKGKPVLFSTEFMVVDRKCSLAI